MSNYENKIKAIKSYHTIPDVVDARIDETLDLLEESKTVRKNNLIKLVPVAAILAICVVAGGMIWNKDKVVSAEVGFVNLDKGTLEYKGMEGELELYTDEENNKFFFRGDKLTMVHMMTQDFEGDMEKTATEDEIRASAREWLNNQFDIKLPEDVEERIEAIEGVGGFDYNLEQRLGNSSITLVTLTFMANGDLIGANFYDDLYLVKKEKNKLLAYTDEMAIETATEYVKNDEEMMKQFSFIFDEETEVSVHFARISDKFYREVSFKREYNEDEMEKCPWGHECLFIYIDAEEHTVYMYDQCL